MAPKKEDTCSFCGDPLAWTETPLRKALLVLLAVVAVLGLVAYVTAVATIVVHSLTSPSPPDPCHDGHLKEDSWNECPHSDHRLFIEGDFAVCRCEEPADG